MIYKRGKTYWYGFLWHGQRVQESTRQGNPNVARQIEAAHLTSLAKGEVGIRERKPIPTLVGFEQRFLDQIRVDLKDKSPETIKFYICRYAVLLDFKPLARARLDQIDLELIDQFTAKMVNENYSGASVNRALATLRRALHLALRWKLIASVPRIKMLEEKTREFVLSREQQAEYLEACPTFLRNFAEFALETGCRRKELCDLRWTDIYVKPVGRAQLGYAHISGTKSKCSKRNIPLTATAQAVLLRQRTISDCEYVFVSDSDHAKPASTSALNHCHERVRDVLNLSPEFVLHSLRHTYATRLGKAHVDAFTIQKLLGHASIVISQRYVHPTAGAMEDAVKSLEAANGDFLAEAETLTTISTTLESPGSDRVQ
jgi:integrase